MDTPADEWITRVASLNQWRRGGERAPHKPLLLLYMLGRLQRVGSGSVTFTDAEADLRRLLEEFGPPRQTSPGYPFHHLTSDGLWVVRTSSGEGSPGPNLKDLRAGAVGGLDSDFARALERDPALFSGIVHSLLDANFPPTLHNDILEAVGIELEMVEVRHVPKARRRDPGFRDLVLLAYEYRCAFCGFDGQLMREAVAIDAAHVRWWAASGPDDLSNGVALCSLHHKLFDRGALGIGADRTVTVSSHFITRSTSGEQLVLDLIGKTLMSPQPGDSTGSYPTYHLAHLAGVSLTGPGIGGMSAALLHPHKFVLRVEVLTRPCPVPALPGVYAWWFREIPPGLVTGKCLTHDDLTLLYVGISPKRPPKEGRSSRQTLRTRIRYHYRGNAEGSTLRLTLGCLLSERLGLCLYRVGSGKRMTFCEGEAVLSDWMASNAFVSWMVATEPWITEAGLIKSVNLPLNIDQNAHSPSIVAVRTARKEAEELAQCRPVHS